MQCHKCCQEFVSFLSKHSPRIAVLYDIILIIQENLAKLNNPTENANMQFFLTCIGANFYSNLANVGLLVAMLIILPNCLLHRQD